MAVTLISLRLGEGGVKHPAQRAVRGTSELCSRVMIPARSERETAIWRPLPRTPVSPGVAPSAVAQLNGWDGMDDILADRPHTTRSVPP